MSYCLGRFWVPRRICRNPQRPLLARPSPLSPER
jgi:hypothetical protein